MLLHEVEEVVRNVISSHAAGVDTEGRFPQESIEALRDIGALRLTIPVEDGGYGASLADVAPVVTTVAESCASTAMILVMHYTALTALVELTAGPQRIQTLGAVVKDGLLVTEAISEPAAGSQWWSVGSVAELVTDGYQLQVQKSFATSAGYADLYITSTRSPEGSTDRDHALFVVDARSQYVETGQWNGLGLRGNSSTTFSFEGVVPDWARLDAPGSDALRKYNEINQPTYHLGFGAVYLGIARAARDAAIDRARSRRYREGANQHGPRLGDIPVTRRHVGEMHVRIAALESLVASFAAHADSANELDSIAAQMTALKVAASELAVEVARTAMLTAGGASYARGFLPIERTMRDALAGSLMGPNDDFSKELIGRLLIDETSYHAL